MEEKNTAQNVENQVDINAFEEEDEIFDMQMATKAAEEMFEKQQKEELNKFKEIEGFAAIFPDNWVLTPPTDPKTVAPIISKQLAKKTKKMA